MCLEGSSEQSSKRRPLLPCVCPSKAAWWAGGPGGPRRAGGSSRCMSVPLGPPLQTTPGRGNLHIYLVPPCPKGGGAGTHPLIAAGKHPQPGPGLSVITRLSELSWLRTAGSSAPGAPGSSAINPQHQQRQLMPARERSSGVPRDGGANSPGPPRDRGFSWEKEQLPGNGRRKSKETPHPRCGQLGLQVPPPQRFRSCDVAMFPEQNTGTLLSQKGHFHGKKPAVGRRAAPKPASSSPHAKGEEKDHFSACTEQNNQCQPGAFPAL